MGYALLCCLVRVLGCFDLCTFTLLFCMLRFRLLVIVLIDDIILLVFGFAGTLFSCYGFVLRMFVFSVACLLCFVVVVIDLHDFVFWFALVWFW